MFEWMAYDYCFIAHALQAMLQPKAVPFRALEEELCNFVGCDLFDRMEDVFFSLHLTALHIRIYIHISVCCFWLSSFSTND